MLHSGNIKVPEQQTTLIICRSHKQFSYQERHYHILFVEVLYRSVLKATQREKETFDLSMSNKKIRMIRALVNKS